MHEVKKRETVGLNGLREFLEVCFKQVCGIDHGGGVNNAGERGIGTCNSIVD